jgi:hypothetical protein
MRLERCLPCWSARMSDVESLFARLRTGLDITSGAVAYQQLYEHWCKSDSWSLGREALPLLVGVDPAAWQHHVEAQELQQSAEALLQLISAGLDCRPDAQITPARIRHWAREQGIALPEPLARVLDFILSVLPPVMRDPQAMSGADQSADRERALGAALALVTKFPDQCRDEHGFFDGARIAALILDKRLLWFPEGGPAFSAAEIAALLENYLS